MCGFWNEYIHGLKQHQNTRYDKSHNLYVSRVYAPQKKKI